MRAAGSANGANNVAVLIPCHRVVRSDGSLGGYAYGLVAMGLIDAVIETSLKPWDIQALIPIVEGAGGVVTSWTGGGKAVTSLST